MATVANEVGSFVYDICQAKDFGNGVIVEQYDNTYAIYYPYYSGGNSNYGRYSGKHCLQISATHMDNHIYRHNVQPKIGDKVLVIEGKHAGIVDTVWTDSDHFVIFEDGKYCGKKQVVVLPPKLREGDTIEDNFKPGALWKQEYTPDLKFYDELTSAARERMIAFKPTYIPASERMKKEYEEMLDDSFDAVRQFTGLFCSSSNNNSKKESFMSRLRDIPNRIKRLLNKGEQAMYELGWIDSDLDVADNGIDAMNDFLFEKFREELGAEAIKQTADIKKKEAEVKKQA